jgi:hypothetical protein
MAQQLQWFDRSQPQTLQNGVVLAYFQAVLTLFFTLIGGGGGLALLIAIAPALALGGGAFGIANSKKRGYWLAVVASIVIFGLYLWALWLGAGFGIILDLLFSGVTVALLLHPLSRSYQKIWFK